MNAFPVERFAEFHAKVNAKATLAQMQTVFKALVSEPARHQFCSHCAGEDPACHTTCPLTELALFLSTAEAPDQRRAQLWILDERGVRADASQSLTLLASRLTNLISSLTEVRNILNGLASQVHDLERDLDLALDENQLVAAGIARRRRAAGPAEGEPPAQRPRGEEPAASG